MENPTCCGSCSSAPHCGEEFVQVVSSEVVRQEPFSDVKGAEHDHCRGTHQREP